MSGFIASIFALTFFILETGWFNITYEEWLKDKPKSMRSMLGREDFLGTSTEYSGGTDRSKTIKTFNQSLS